MYSSYGTVGGDHTREGVRNEYFHLPGYGAVSASGFQRFLVRAEDDVTSRINVLA